MDKNKEISKERLDKSEIEKEEEIETKFKNDLTPAPSGKAFLKLFRSVITEKQGIKYVPFMYSDSLDRDINLYKAMLIILGNIAGKATEIGNNKLALKANKFMKSEPMTSLMANEFASNEHENGSREKCYDFIKKVLK